MPILPPSHSSMTVRPLLPLSLPLTCTHIPQILHTFVCPTSCGRLRSQFHRRYVADAPACAEIRFQLFPRFWLFSCVCVPLPHGPHVTQLPQQTPLTLFHRFRLCFFSFFTHFRTATKSATRDSAVPPSCTGRRHPHPGAGVPGGGQRRERAGREGDSGRQP